MARRPTPEERLQKAQTQKYFRLAMMQFGEVVYRLGSRAARLQYPEFSKHQAMYWRRRYLDETFHPQWHGGFRWQKYTSDEWARIKTATWNAVTADPCRRLVDYLKTVQETVTFPNKEVSRDDLQLIFKEFQWTFKRPDWKQLHKYDEENLARYAAFLRWIAFANPAEVHFLDEAHFMSRDLWVRRGVAERGKRCIYVHNVPMDYSFSITIMTTYGAGNEPPLQLDLREESNTAEDFLQFIRYLCETGKLPQGHVLVLDNASVHTSDDIQEALDELEEEYGVTFYYLPPYSPELNPSELVFAKIKNTLRSRTSDLQLWEAVIRATATFPSSSVDKFYHHCNLTRRKMAEVAAAAIQCGDDTDASG